MFKARDVLSVITLCSLFYLGYEYSDISSVFHNTSTNGTNKYLSNNLKTILLWNNFFDMPHFNLGGIGRIPFQMHGCSVNNCYVIDSLVEQLETPVEDYDAILFHMYDTDCLELPQKRKPHQRYVFFLLESPQSVPVQRECKDSFNWTMTYRRDSDIWAFYGSLTSRLFSATEDPRSANFHSIHPRVATNESLVDKFDLSQKKYLVAWFASNCETPSQREIYARQLATYIPVHIYGLCGNYSCPEENHTACLELVERNYKFYLSFENSVCKDYVTEKLFDIIKYNVVPIVYGGANYSEFMPRMSFINVADFLTPRDLANYLLYLDESPDQYVEYFWWKSFFSFRQSKVVCKLCEMLHNSSLPPKVYPDIREWWEGKNTCSVPGKSIENKYFASFSPRMKSGNNRRRRNEMFLYEHISYYAPILLLLFLMFSL